MVSARLPRGAREYLLGRAETLTDTILSCTTIFEQWGARRVVPSTLSYADENHNGPDSVTFAERETGKNLALRRDLTDQIRRIVDAELAHLPVPFKLYYLERVWSQPRASSPRATEQIQAGVEWIGPQAGSESELLRLASRIATGFDDQKPTMAIGHADLRRFWLESLDLVDAVAAAQALDDRDLSAWAAAGDPALPHLPILTVRSVSDLPEETPAPVREIVTELARLVEELDQSIDAVIDPVVRPDNEYYNGMFFVVSSGIAGDPWLRGGRYDGRFSKPVDALGFALDLDPLMDAADSGRMSLSRRPRILWMGPGPAPDHEDYRWVPVEPGMTTPRDWAKAHGLDGLASRVDNEVRIEHIEDGREIDRLPATGDD